MSTPARFFQLPDGRPSSVQVKVVADATGGVTLVPLAITTPQQAAEWDQIQAAAPLTATERLTQLNAAAARPVTPAEAEADATFGGSLLDGLRAAAAAESATVPAAPPPRSQAEHDQRATALAAVAARLDLQLVMVRDDPVMKVPAHLEVRQSGYTYAAGDLPALEVMLHGMARERARRDEQIALWEAHRAQQAAEQAERIANLPANRLARLEAALAAQGITVDA